MDDAVQSSTRYCPTSTSQPAIAMGHPSNMTSEKHQSSALNASNGPPSKRQKTSTTSSNSTIDDSSGSCPGVLAAVSKLTKLVENYPHFHSKLEGMLQDLYNTLEPEVSAAIRKEENAISCPIFKLSNDEVKHVLGYVGLLHAFQIGSMKFILKRSEMKRQPA